MSACCANFCHFRSSRKSETQIQVEEKLDEKIRFYRFPKIQELRNAWIKAVGREHWIPQPGSRLCHHHFTKDCFYKCDVNNMLKHGSIPTIFPTKETELSNSNDEKMTWLDECEHALATFQVKRFKSEETQPNNDSSYKFNDWSTQLPTLVPAPPLVAAPFGPHLPKLVPFSEPSPKIDSRLIRFPSKPDPSDPAPPKVVSGLILYTPKPVPLSGPVSPKHTSEPVSAPLKVNLRSVVPPKQISDHVVSLSSQKLVSNSAVLQKHSLDPVVPPKHPSYPPPSKSPTNHDSPTAPVPAKLSSEPILHEKNPSDTPPSKLPSDPVVRKTKRRSGLAPPAHPVLPPLVPCPALTSLPPNPSPASSKAVSAPARVRRKPVARSGPTSSKAVSDDPKAPVPSSSPASNRVPPTIPLNPPEQRRPRKQLSEPGKVKEIEERLTKYKAEEQKNRKTLLQKLRRNQKTIKRLNAKIADLKKKEDSDTVIDDLFKDSQGICPSLFKLCLRKNDGHREREFDPKLKEFARVLYICSPKAYNYVRRQFDFCLPHEKTVIRWKIAAKNKNEVSKKQTAPSEDEKEVDDSEDRLFTDEEHLSENEDQHSGDEEHLIEDDDQPFDDEEHLIDDEEHLIEDEEQEFFDEEYLMDDQESAGEDDLIERLLQGPVIRDGDQLLQEQMMINEVHLIPDLAITNNDHHGPDRIIKHERQHFEDQEMVVEEQVIIDADPLTMGEMVVVGSSGC